MRRSFGDSLNRYTGTLTGWEHFWFQDQQWKTYIHTQVRMKFSMYVFLPFFVSFFVYLFSIKILPHTKKARNTFQFKFWRHNLGRDSSSLLMINAFAHGALLRRTTLYDLTTIAQYLIIVFCLSDTKSACWLLGLKHGLSAQLGSTWVQTPIGQMIFLCTV